MIVFDCYVPRKTLISKPEVLRVRNESKHLLGRDGRDGIWWDGRWVYLPTRDDFKANTYVFSFSELERISF